MPRNGFRDIAGGPHVDGRFEVATGSARQVQWLYSFVTDDKTYCVYIAPDEEILRQHSERAGFPVTRVSKVTSMLDPAASE